MAPTALGIFTSRQAEALCKSRPPTAACRPRVQLVRQKLPSAASSFELNCDDLPEAGLPSTARTGCRRYGPSCKPRCGILGLPILVEDEAKTPTDSEAEAPEEWPCPACTFMNHGLLSMCEICVTGRDTQPLEAQLQHNAGGPSGALELGASASAEWPPVLAAAAEDAWPSLAEVADSWVHCEVSSMGSSWLDVDVANTSEEEVLEEGDDVRAVLVSTSTVGAHNQDAKQLQTWAARASAAAWLPAGKGPVARGAAVPPLQQSRPAAGGRGGRCAAGRPSEEEGEEEAVAPELEDLEARRMCPRTSRGARQRLRIRRH